MHKRIKTQLGIAFATIISTAQQQMFDISAPNKKKKQSMKIHQSLHLNWQETATSCNLQTD